MDFNSLTGLELAYESLLHIQSHHPSDNDNYHVRIGWLSNPATSSPHSIVSYALQSVLNSHTLARSLDFAEKLLKYAIAHSATPITAADILALAKDINGIKLDKLEKDLQSLENDDNSQSPLGKQLNSQRSFCRNVIKLDDSETKVEDNTNNNNNGHFSAIITNGRSVLLDNQSPFLAADFQLLSNYEYNRRSKKVVEQWLNQEGVNFEGLEAEEQTSDFVSDVVMKVVSVIGSDEEKGIQKIVLPSAEVQRYPFSLLHLDKNIIIMDESFSPCTNIPLFFPYPLLSII